jgi:hypothetical protein
MFVSDHHAVDGLAQVWAARRKLRACCGPPPRRWPAAARPFDEPKFDTKIALAAPRAAGRPAPLATAASVPSGCRWPAACRRPRRCGAGGAPDPGLAPAPSRCSVAASAPPATPSNWRRVSADGLSDRLIASPFCLSGHLYVGTHRVFHLLSVSCRTLPPLRPSGTPGVGLRRDIEHRGLVLESVRELSNQISRPSAVHVACASAPAVLVTASRRCHPRSCEDLEVEVSMRRVNTTLSPVGEMKGKLSKPVVSTLTELSARLRSVARVSAYPGCPICDNDRLPSGCQPETAFTLLCVT